MACTGVLAFVSPPSKVCKTTTSLPCSLHHSPSTTCAASTNEQQLDISETTTNARQKFSYSRASPSVRWPNLKLSETYPSPNTLFNAPSPPPTHLVDEMPESKGEDGTRNVGSAESLEVDDETQERLGRRSRTGLKK